MNVRSFTLPGKRLLNQFDAKIATRLSEWGERWNIDATLQQANNFIVAKESSHRTQSALRLQSMEADAWMVVQIDQDKREQLGANLLNPSIAISETIPKSQFLSELCLQAFLDLASAFDFDGNKYRIDKQGTVMDCLETEDWKKDSRSLCLEISIADDAISIFLPWATAEQFIESYIDAEIMACEPQELVARLNAIDTEKVSTQAMLGNAELTLEALSSLRVGDVLCLDKNLDDALTLNFKNSTSKFSGFLGKQDENLAIQIENFIES